MWIFERCLQKITDLNGKNMQLLAITCLFISAKYEEIYPPHVMVLIEKTLGVYHKKQVVELEQKILIALGFQLTAPNRYTFMNLATNSNTYLD
jgi:cyclin A